MKLDYCQLPSYHIHLYLFMSLNLIWLHTTASCVSISFCPCWVPSLSICPSFSLNINVYMERALFFWPLVTWAWNCPPVRWLARSHYSEWRLIYQSLSILKPSVLHHVSSPSYLNTMSTLEVQPCQNNTKYVHLASFTASFVFLFFPQLSLSIILSPPFPCCTWLVSLSSLIHHHQNSVRSSFCVEHTVWSHVHS